MTRRLHLRVIAPSILMAVAVIVVSIIPAGRVAATTSHSLIQGSGSSWSANAVNQWIADVQSNGLQVVFTPSGSAQGRKDFGYRTNDFAVSEIGYRGTDPLTGEADNSQGRAYAYLPIVSGGTAFPYQIRVGGEMVRNLRLSGESLAKIFTNQITDWSDPAITRDNNGRALPSLPIIPVVHSEGSGSSAHFSEFLANQFPDLWHSFSGQSGFTEYFPRKDPAIAQSGSDGVMNFVTSSAANGAIGFDEYSYALGKDYPVAKIENAAGYYTLPTQYNVAVALTQAIINTDKSSPDYLLQDLDNVYGYNDSRVYPLSSYSYGIIPTAGDDTKMTSAKRQTLADFLYYSICDGQKEMGPIGYSPLPINLVQAGFDQIGLLAKADPGVDLTNRDVSSCNNPTFIAGEPNRNYLAEVAPQIPACDQDGQGPCVDSAAGADPATSAGASKSGADGADAAENGGGAQAGGATATTTVDAAQAGAAAVAAAAHTSRAKGVADAPPTVSAATDKSPTLLLAVLAIGLLVVVIIAPVALVRAFNAERRSGA